MQRFVVGLTPLPTAARVSRHRSALRMRIVTSLISLAVTAVIIWFFRDQWSTTWLITIASLWVASTAFWFGVSAVGLRNAKRDLARIPRDRRSTSAPRRRVLLPGERPCALGGRDRTQAQGGALGAGPSVALEAGGARVAEVPLSFLDAAPAVIDSAARAYSLGRVQLDTEALDRVV
ncbi:hypothetical protein G7085_08090 [Tessaracoccus sp. HDW20]|uniref:hypothetical protein n=1 Tax=Tessaracoccus coleopterorum TaxID=2714950 RepID=UPI0018D461D9|nr:hypothetical protein [Tessaracoccus coleopterorum]NHB84584.1 hypothetical protein [Tessaracoccus coleopterorum]